MTLHLVRKENEQIMIGDSIILTVLYASYGKTKLSVKSLNRTEVLFKRKSEFFTIDKDVEITVIDARYRKFTIDKDVEITVIDARYRKAKLAIKSPPHKKIWRKELYDKMKVGEEK